MTNDLQVRMLTEAICCNLGDLERDIRSEETESALSLAVQVKVIRRMAEILREAVKR